MDCSPAACSGVLVSDGPRTPWGSHEGQRCQKFLPLRHTEWLSVWGDTGANVKPHAQRHGSRRSTASLRTTLLCCQVEETPSELSSRLQPSAHEQTISAACRFARSPRSYRRGSVRVYCALRCLQNHLSLLRTCPRR